MSNRFKTDLEKLIEAGIFTANNGKVRFVFRYGDRLKGGVDLLELNERGYNVLRRNGVHTLEGIDSAWDKLGTFKNAGVKTVKEIKNKYLAYYYDTLDSEEKRKQFWADTIKATMEMEV